MTRISASISAALLLAACGGGNSASSTGGTGAGPGARVQGKAHFLAGPTPVAAPKPAPPTGPVPQDFSQKYLISPGKVEVTITAIAFHGSTSSDHQPLTGCVVTYDATAGSLASLSDCSFQIAEGDYTDLTIEYDRTFKVLIDSPVTQVYTDPGSPTGLSSAAPAGGAQPIDYQVTGGGSAVLRFTQPFGVHPGTPLDVDVVLHGLHTIAAGRDPMGMPGFRYKDYDPVAIFPSVTGAKAAAFYSSIGTGADMDVSLAPPAEVFFFFDDHGPTVAGVTYTGGLEKCAMPGDVGFATNANPATSPMGMGGSRAGGYLGLDGAHTLCWALPTDDAFSAYQSLWSMPEATSAGGSTTLTCQAAMSVPAPTSGDTYASGCPPITTPTATVTLELVAQ